MLRNEPPYTYSMRAISRRQPSSSSWMIQSASIQRYSIPSLREIAMTSWKVLGNLFSGIPAKNVEALFLSKKVKSLAFHLKLSCLV